MFRLLYTRVLTFKHSGDIGDLFFCLATMKALGGGILYLNCQPYPWRELQKRGSIEAQPIQDTKYDGSRTGFTEKQIQDLLSLLVLQDYIYDVKIWDGESIDYNLDEWRLIHGWDYYCNSIVETSAKAFDVSIDFCQPWIQIDKPLRPQITLLTRTGRYIPKFYNLNWRKYLKGAFFVGLDSEYNQFVESVGYCDRMEVCDFYEIARCISGSQQVVGGQGAIWSLAAAMGVTSIQETCDWCCTNVTSVNSKWVFVGEDLSRLISPDLPRQVKWFFNFTRRYARKSYL